MEVSTSIRLALALLAFSFLVAKIRHVGQRPQNYPPGPPTLPILGNIHQMPRRDPHKQFQKWAQQYGPVYSLILGTQTIIVLSSASAVKDLLDKRSSIYSSRLDNYVAQDLCSGGLRFLLMPYGSEWRTSRKIVHAHLNIQAAQSYVPYQDLESKQMLNELLQSPNTFLNSIKRYSYSSTTSIAFGYRTTKYDDPRLTNLFEEFQAFGELVQVGVTQLVDFFPILRSLPTWLSPTMSAAKRLHRREKEFYRSMWLEAKNGIATGKTKPCFCVDLASQQKKFGFSDDRAAYTSGAILEAGSDTTSHTLNGFMQAMVLFPEVQKKAQMEIDAVVGATKRLPDMSDEPNLQYIRGCVKESLRWMPTTILGAVPHALSADDTYMGYHLPAGAGVVQNVYTINMDPKRYPEPRRFMPERYANDFKSAYESANATDVQERDHFTFGSGRRVCQGMHVAERSLFLAISGILWGFNIEAPVDQATGKPIFPDADHYTQGFVVQPETYQAKITPRSREKAEVMEMEWAKAQEKLDPVTGQWANVPEGLFGAK